MTQYRILLIASSFGMMMALAGCGGGNDYDGLQVGAGPPPPPATNPPPPPPPAPPPCTPANPWDYC